MGRSDLEYCGVGDNCGRSSLYVRGLGLGGWRWVVRGTRYARATLVVFA